MIRCRLYVLWLVCLVGCGNENAPQPKSPLPANRTQADSITLATTTSTQDSGLFDVLLPAFERESGITLKVIAVGSGQALELARRGDADVLLVHSPVAEQEFMEQGWGAKRLAVMHNDFVILGPLADGAEIKMARSAADAFMAIARRQSTFVSRGDDSGTHKKEVELWKAAGLKPGGDWYIVSGAGMAQALRIANEKNAYIVSDRGTYLALADELALAVLLEGDDQLVNRYSVITINPERHPHIHHREATRFAEYLVSTSGQRAIGDFGVERFGQALFIPDAGEQILDAKK
jgi:tungstate transport system substrate-binding protein